MKDVGDIYYSTTSTYDSVNILTNKDNGFGHFIDEKIGIAKYNYNIKQYIFHKSRLKKHLSHDTIQGIDRIMTELSDRHKA
jgi:hypothetical protein